MNSKKSNDRADLMRTERGMIGLGDLMHALKGLHAEDPKTVERIARALGFSGMDANPVEEVKGISGVPQRPRVTQRAPATDLPRHGAVPPVAARPELPAEIFDMDMEEISLPASEVARPDWLEGGPLTDLAGGISVHRASLFPERSAKGVLTASVATRRPGRIPYVPQLIRALTRGQILTEFPYRSRPSLHRGVQLLMDTSEAMTPFLEDLDDLAKALTTVVGKHACELFQFAGDPNNASRWSRDFREVRWQPVSGRPVVFATDFGIGAQAAAQDRAGMGGWRRFVQQATEAGVPVIAFVPYGRDRWPKSLTRRIRFIHWDPRTRASHIKKLFGPGHEVAG